MRAMLSYLKVAAIQYHCVRVLGTLALMGENRVQLVDEGAHTSIMDAVRNLPNDIDVQTHACVALALLGSHLCTRDRLWDSGNIEAHQLTITAMLSHPFEEGLQIAGCISLAMCLGAANKYTAMLTGLSVHDLVLQAMKNHRCSADLQEHASLVLRRLSQGATM
jgi:hypothetical protein